MTDAQRDAGVPRVDLARETDFALGAMRIRPASREVIVEGNSQVLQPRVMQVLVALARRRGEVVSRDDLVTSCWEGLSVSEDAISRCIGQLRRLSEQDGGQIFSIETVARVGYRITVNDAASVAAAQLRATSQTDAISIAVLPFVNMSSDAEQEYFSDGLSEELMNQLAQLKGLQVAGRTSSFAFKGKTEDFRMIGDKLGVNHILEGSVRKAGKRLRITAQLIKCADGYHLWSQAYDRELDDVFAIQDEVARSVAEALGVALGVGETTRMPGGTDNVAAFDLMLRARAIIRRRALGDAQRATELLRQALDLDPKFALAWNVLGNALTSVLTWDPKNREAIRSEIDEALEHSMRLAPDLWTAHEARANQLEFRYDWVEAEKANAKSLALAPKSMREPLVSRAHQLAIVGRVTEAIPFAREAARVEPLAPSTLQAILSFAGRYAEAEAEYERSKDLPRDQFLSEIFAVARMLAIKDHDRANKHLSLCAAIDPDPRSVHRAMLDVFDNSGRARALLRRVLKEVSQPDREVVRLLSLTPYAAYFGEPALALSAFARIAPNMLGVMIPNIWAPLYSEMRKLPGFKDLVRELNIVTYWRTTGNWGEFARPLGTDDFECW